MDKTEFTQAFYDKFFENYRKKNYNDMVDSISTFTKFKITYDIREKCENLHVFSMVAMKYRNKVDSTDLMRIFNNYKYLIFAAYGYKKLECFTLLEYGLQLKEFSQIVIKPIVEDMITDILDSSNLYPAVTIKDVQILEKFFIVLIGVESLVPMPNTFPNVQKVLRYFQKKLLTGQEIKSGCPELLSKTLQVLQLCKDDNQAKPVFDELLERLKKLVTDNIECRKDIAIMISRMIGACTSLIVKESSTYYIQKILAIIEANYGILRDKTINSKEYLWAKRLDTSCCKEGKRHDGLGIVGIPRRLLIGLIDRKMVDEVIVSACVNFMVVEATILETLECSNRPNLFIQVANAIRDTVKNVDVIIQTCGRDRGIRTIRKFLSIQTKEKYLPYHNILQELIAIYAKNNQLNEQIDLQALRFLYAEKKSKVFCVFELHKVQKVIGSKFETISTILRKLEKTAYGMDLTFDSLKIQFTQLFVEIEYPQLNEVCRKIIISDIRELDAYKNTEDPYVNLVKANVLILECMIDIDHYKSTVKFNTYHQPFEVDDISFKYEKNLIGKMEESLKFFSTFFNDLDKWKDDPEKDDYVSNMIAMLNKIGLWLINRQYKDLAVTAFDLLYRVATMSNNQLKQIVAAGYLIENISLHPNIFIEEELVADLQSNILRKFKEVNSMSENERSNFLHAFLQLTMYTLRCTNNMEHAKKYMQAINKLLNKYDTEKVKLAALRLKYSEVMFEMIVTDPNTTITPITFIEDIFHRFKNTQFNSKSDVDVISGILWDIMNTLYEYTQVRYEFRSLSSLMWTLFYISFRSGFIFLLAKVLVMISYEYLLSSNTRWKDHLTQLDTVFECSQSGVRKKLEPSKEHLTQLESARECKPADVLKPLTSSEATWNHEITPYIHSNCACFHCTHKYVNQLKMAVASIKASASYYTRDFETSLQSFEQSYNHWKYEDNSAYVSMLMNYSNCLISKSRKNESRDLLFEALNLTNRSDTYYAQCQDISLRLLFSTKKDEIHIDQTPSYANAETEYQAKKICSRTATIPSVKKVVRVAPTARSVPVEPSEKRSLRSRTVKITKTKK